MTVYTGYACDHPGCDAKTDVKYNASPPIEWFKVVLPKDGEREVSTSGQTKRKTSHFCGEHRRCRRCNRRMVQAEDGRPGAKNAFEGMVRYYGLMTCNSCYHRSRREEYIERRQAEIVREMVLARLSPEQAREVIDAMGIGDGD